MRWKREYILELRELHCYAKKPPKESSCETIAIGDVVLVNEENRPRECWKLAKVDSLIKGADGLIVGASVRLRSSDKHSTTTETSTPSLVSAGGSSMLRESR